MLNYCTILSETLNTSRQIYHFMKLVNCQLFGLYTFPLKQLNMPRVNSN